MSTMSKKSSKTDDRKPLLQDTDDDGLGAPPPSYFASASLQLQLAPPAPPTIADFQQPPTAQTPQLTTSWQGVPMAAYSTAAPALAQTSLQTTEPIFEPPQSTAQTSSIPKLLFLRGLMNQPPVARRSSQPQTNSFNPFVDTDANPSVPIPPTINISGSATSSSFSSPVTSTHISVPSAPPIAQSSSIATTAVATEEKVADHTQFVYPAQTIEPSEILADPLKEQARQELLILMRTFYIRADSSETRSKVREQLIKKTNLIRKQFNEKDIDKWFLNLPIDREGNTIAHWVAINGDYKLLKVLLELGVDMFKPNFKNKTPEQRVHQACIESARLTPTERQKFLNEPEPEAEKKKVRRRRSSSDNSSTSSATSTSISVAEQKKRDLYYADQRRYAEQREMKWFTRFEETKKFFMDLREKQEKNK